MKAQKAWIPSSVTANYGLTLTSNGPTDDFLVFPQADKEDDAQAGQDMEDVGILNQQTLYNPSRLSVCRENIEIQLMAEAIHDNFATPSLPNANDSAADDECCGLNSMADDTMDHDAISEETNGPNNCVDDTMNMEARADDCENSINVESGGDVTGTTIRNSEEIMEVIEAV